jgi:hypothetical protein
MLDHISYIDECDTLGRKAEEKKIHKVYSKNLAHHLSPANLTRLHRHSYQCTKKFWSSTKPYARYSKEKELG